MKIWVVDNGSQWTHRQGRVLRYMKQDTQIVPNDTPVEELEAAGLDGIVLSGGGARVGLDGGLGQVGAYLDRLDVPVLGVCAGHQFMARHFGGQAAPGAAPEFGQVEIEVLEEDDILRGVPHKTIVWASHHDEVSVLPPGFKVLARSDACPIQVMRHAERPLFGMSFHPEVEHTQAGVTMFRNFVRICGERKAA
ncbi:MAG TPA: GMP synthase subunit A [Candidatus Thermoplasmatota archaeon]|nr:GMP synthase subunit A [Candidatus Thermoplasmatota archaeon]